MDGNRCAEPQVAVRQLSAKRGATADRWRVTWRIRNQGAEQLKILSARLPHGKFRWEERELTPAIDLGPREERRLELEVRCSEPAGTEVENAFLILRVLWREKPWLILARIRVHVNQDGAPATATELITAQRVGFSRQQAES